MDASELDLFRDFIRPFIDILDESIVSIPQISLFLTQFLKSDSKIP